jgi:hypothetical protein
VKWTDGLVEAIPTLGVLSGVLEPQDGSPGEFMRKTDATNNGEPLFEGPDVALMTMGLKAKCQLDMDFKEFPFDRQTLQFTFFLPKKHKDSKYVLRAPEGLSVPSENIKPKADDGDGKGVLEIKDQVATALIEWDIESTELDMSKADDFQSKATIVIKIKRRSAYYDDKYITRPGVIASLAVLSAIFPVEDIGSRCQITLTLLLTLMSLNFASSEQLPYLPYLTKLDRYHDHCYGLVLFCIAQNILCYVLAERFKYDCSTRDDESMILIVAAWIFINKGWIKTTIGAKYVCIFSVALAALLLVLRFFGKRSEGGHLESAVDAHSEFTTKMSSANAAGRLFQAHHGGAADIST